MKTEKSRLKLHISNFPWKQDARVQLLLGISLKPKNAGNISMRVVSGANKQTARENKTAYITIKNEILGTEIKAYFVQVGKAHMLHQNFHAGKFTFA